MLADFLAPVSGQLIDSFVGAPEFKLSQHTLFHKEIEGLPDLKDIKVALIGIQEDRGSTLGRGCDAGVDKVRKILYNLNSGSWPAGFADLGNIFKGETRRDTYFAIQEVGKILLQKGITLLIIGGSQDLTYANYRGYDKLEQMVNLVSIDKEFDLGAHEEGVTDRNYLSHIILNQPFNLFNFGNIGYQTFYTHQEEIDLMERMYFETYRLGKIKENIKEIEPVVRDADIISFDLGCVKTSDSPGHIDPEPNGFDGIEACTIARYSGLSDKVSSFGIYNYYPQFDQNNQSAKLIAQMLWYFLEGYFHRKGDYPFSSKRDYMKFIVLIEDGAYEMVFFKSPKSNRWWIEVPGNRPDGSANQLFPCTYEDYLSACQQIIPGRWWKARQRSM
jgi:arginase family enzyme